MPGAYDERGWGEGGSGGATEGGSAGGWKVGLRYISCNRQAGHLSFISAQAWGGVEGVSAGGGKLRSDGVEGGSAGGGKLGSDGVEGVKKLVERQSIHHSLADSHWHVRKIHLRSYKCHFPYNRWRVGSRNTNCSRNHNCQMKALHLQDMLTQTLGL